MDQKLTSENTLWQYSVVCLERVTSTRPSFSQELRTVDEAAEDEVAHIKINICRKCVGSTHHYLHEQVQKFHPIPHQNQKKKPKEGREQTRKIIMVYSYLLAIFCTKSNEIYTNIIR